MDLDQIIPGEWRLKQHYDKVDYFPETYPVFLKPEWGENAGGIVRADSESDLRRARETVADSKVQYLIQQGATQSREFEIFSLRDAKDKSTYSVLSITEAINTKEVNPVNSIYNPNTQYADITDQMNGDQQQKLWTLLERIGRFSICRLSVRADSIEQLLDENFSVIELNLFTPMPIHLLDKKYSLLDLTRMVLNYMMKLAKLTRVRDKSLVEKPVYTKLMLYNREGGLANFIRNRI